jgi:integrase
MSLSETKIKGLKPGPKPHKVFDERGLYLLVTPKGGKLWRFKYRLHGREKLISLGQYPDVSLADARESRDAARRKVAKDIDPSMERRLEKDSRAITFESVATEWLGKLKHLNEGTVRRDRDRLKQFVYPHIGTRPIGEVTAPELLHVLRRIEARGTLETAKRTRAVCGRVLRYAIATGRADRDVSADLKGALSPVVPKSHAALTDPKRVGELLRAIDGYQGQPVTMCALKLAPYVFVRPGELRAAEWKEFDLDGEHPLWRIPAERMKMREPHLVPLAHQAVAIMREIEKYTSDGRFVFPSLRSGGRPMSENTITAALRRLGYSGDEQTGHGFRSIASTMLNELGFNSDVIELQLAHKERNKVRAAYNRAQRLEERRAMMQAWADHLDKLRASDSKQVPKAPQTVATELRA